MTGEVQFIMGAVPPSIGVQQVGGLPLDRVQSWDLSLVLNGDGVLNLTTPVAERNFWQAAYMLGLNNGFSPKVAEIRTYLRGGARSNRLTSHVMSGSVKNLPDEGRLLSVSARLDAVVLTELPIGLAPIDADTTSETDRTARSWKSVTPGALVAAVMDSAMGTYTEVTGLTAPISFDTFDDVRDSAAWLTDSERLWPYKIDYETSGTSTPLDVLKELADRRVLDWECYFYSGVYEVRIYRYGSLRFYENPSAPVPMETEKIEFHFSSGPAVVTDSDFSWDVSERVNAVQVYGGNGHVAETNRINSQYGRILRGTVHLESQPGITESPALQTFSDALVDVLNEPGSTTTVAFLVTPETPLIGVDYGLGDTVTLPIWRHDQHNLTRVVLTYERHRIVGATLAGDQDGTVTGTLTIGYLEQNSTEQILAAALRSQKKRSAA